MTVFFSVGKWGGFYSMSYSVSYRLCLGWVAITVVLLDDDWLLAALDRIEPKP